MFYYLSDLKCRSDLQAVSKLDPTNRQLQSLTRRDQLVSRSE
jgi:hypothetical protein